MVSYFNNKTAIIEEICKATGCECSDIPDNITSEQLTEIYVNELENGKKAGYIPILFGYEDRFCDILNGRCDILNGRIELMKQSKKHRDEILKADISKGKEFLTERSEELYYLYGEIPEYMKCKYNSLNSFISGEDEKYILIKIKSANPWEVFAWIPFGGWNEVPDDEDIMSVCKYWYDEYRAIPAIITHDILQMYVEKPAKNDNSRKLADEQYAFCYDIVAQGVGSVNALELKLIDSKVWYFWWD